MGRTRLPAELRLMLQALAEGLPALAPWAVLLGLMLFVSYILEGR